MMGVLDDPRNKYIALALRLRGTLNKDLIFDKKCTGLRGKCIEHLDVKMLCESIGIDEKDVVYKKTQREYNEIADEIAELMHTDTLPNLIKKDTFTFSMREVLMHNLSNFIELMYTESDIHFRNFTNKDEIDDLPNKEELVGQYLHRLSLHEPSDSDPIYLCPYLFLNDCDVNYAEFAKDIENEDFPESWQYEIMLDVILTRACVLEECKYRLFEWCINMCTATN